jgi:predicted DNA-binding protein with PD1-like motif
MLTQTHAFRLLPGADLRKSILAFVSEQNILAGWITCGVGSLTRYNIRFADRSEGSTASGHFEIVSLIGTVSKNGSHLHISVSDPNGVTIGGHLLDGNLVYTTAEIVIQSTSELVFTREKDGSTPWEELKIRRRD